MGIGVSIFSSFFTASPSHPIQADAIQSFLPIVLPAAAGCAISLISIFDLGRQLTNSREMQSLLAQARSRVERCENLPSLRRVVESTENAFAAEFLEWFTMFRLPRFN